MAVEILQPASRAAWLELRKATIGASEIAALFGVHPYTTVLDMWARRTGAIKESTEETPPMRRGRHLEAVAVDFLREERPDWIVKANAVPTAELYRDLEIGIGATPDTFVREPGLDGFAICQIKSVEPSVFRRNWLNEAGDVEPPLFIVIQAIQEAFLTGAARAYVAPLVIGFGIEMPVVPIELHAGIVGQIATKAAEFWRMVRDKEMPTPDFAKDGEVLAQIVGNVTEGKSVDLRSDNELPVLASEDRQLSGEIKDRTDRRKEIKAQVLFKIGDADFALMQGGSISAGIIKRKGYIAKESSYREMRIKMSDGR